LSLTLSNTRFFLAVKKRLPYIIVYMFDTLALVHDLVHLVYITISVPFVSLPLSRITECLSTRAYVRCLRILLWLFCIFYIKFEPQLNIRLYLLLYAVLFTDWRRTARSIVLQKIFLIFFYYFIFKIN